MSKSKSMINKSSMHRSISGIVSPQNKEFKKRRPKRHISKRDYTDNTLSISDVTMSDGTYHNICGPVYVGPDGHTEYCVYGQLHRLHDHAVITSEGHGYYYYKGVNIQDHVALQMFKWLKDFRINDVYHMTSDQERMFHQRWDKFLPLSLTLFAEKNNGT